MLSDMQALALAAKEAMSGQLEMLKVKYEEALEARKKAEMEIEAFRPVRRSDRATLAELLPFTALPFLPVNHERGASCCSRMWTERPLPALLWRSSWRTWRWNWSSCREFIRRYNVDPRYNKTSCSMYRSIVL